jgi:hypothetical protein
MDCGSVPQWLTALIAGGALTAAWVSIRSQKELARKRAAIDFFSKTEMDRETLNAHEKFVEAVGVLENHFRQNTLDEFVKTKAYWDIRGYLNLHELMAVGINQRVFDDDVCYDFWASELENAYKKTKPLIEYIQKHNDEESMYCELVVVKNRWMKRG